MKNNLNFFLSKIFNNIRALLINPTQSFPFIVFSKYFYGNLAGFRQNFFGNYQMLLCRLFGKKNINLINSSKKNLIKLKNDGFIKLDNVVDINLISEIRKEIKKIEKKKNLKKTLFIDCNVDDLVAIKKKISLLINEKLQSILEDYYGSGFLVSSISHRHTFALPKFKNNELISDFWHCDSSPNSLLQVFILFKDVDKNCGPFQVIRKKKSQKIVRNGYNRVNREIKSLDLKNDVFSFTGKAGSVMITNTAECLHRATFPEKKGDREMMYVHVLPSLRKTKLNEIESSWIFKYTHPPKNN